uniref:FAD-binding PCMH-type domain-containing protein n=1 Tax=Globodera pallida TaxID=36090 RepID=A0A183BXR1_GLOPA
MHFYVVICDYYVYGPKYDQESCLDKPDAIKLHNWGGNFYFCTQNIQYPRTTAQVQQIVKRAKKLRVIGNRHSFSKIGDSCGTILSTLGMNSIIKIDRATFTVTVQPGITYTDLAPILYTNKLALPNLAALAEISVGGATQTCTHGSGLGHANLATQIRSMQIVLADGTIAQFGPNNAQLGAVACGLGAFGVVTEIELNVVPAYDTISYAFANMPTENLYAHFDEILRLGYKTEMLNTLSNSSVWTLTIVTVVANSKDDEKMKHMSSLFGAVRILEPLTIMQTELNKVQPWYYGLVLLRTGMSGNDGNEIESEFFIPYNHGVPAIKAISTLYPLIRPLISNLLIRTIKEDNLWMSMHNGNVPTVAIHFTWVNNLALVNPALAQVEQILAQFGARPHWAKHFTMQPNQFLHTYTRLNDFRKLADELDPKHKFRNEFLDYNVFG